MPTADAALRIAVETAVGSVQAGMEKIGAAATQGAEGFKTLATGGTAALTGLQAKVDTVSARVTALDAKLAESRGATVLEGRFGKLGETLKGSATAMENASDRGGLLSNGMMFMGGAAGLAAGAVVGLAERFAELVEQERNQAAAAGMSVKSYDEWLQVLLAGGLAQRAASRGFQQFTANIQLALENSKEQTAAFRDLGVSAAFLKAHATDTNAVLMKIADHLHTNGVDAMTAADAYRVFGGRYGQVVAILQKGSVALTQEKQSFQGHAQAVADAADAAERFHTVERQVVDQLQTALLPIFKALPPVIAGLDTAFDVFGAMLQTDLMMIEGYFENAWSGLKTIGRVIVDIAHGDFAGAKRAIIQGNQEIVTNTKVKVAEIKGLWSGTLDSIKTQWHAAMTPTPEPTPARAPHIDFSNFGKKKPKDETAKQQAQQQKALEHWLAIRRENYDKEFMTQLTAEQKAAAADEKAHDQQLKELHRWMLARGQIIDAGYMKDLATAEKAAERQARIQKQNDDRLAGELQTALSTRYGLRNFFAEKVNALIRMEMATGIRLGASYLAQKLGLDKQEQKSSASTAAANAGKSVSSIPIIGAFLAPITAASVFAELMSFDRGGIVPETSIAMVHKNEMVLPAAIANTVRQAAQRGGSAPGGAGAMHVHYTAHVQALDRDGVSEVLNRHGAEVAATLQRWYRSKNRG